MINQLDLFLPTGPESWRAHLDSMGGMYADMRKFGTPMAASPNFCAPSEGIAKMRYFGYKKVDSLIHLDKVISTGQCAALIQYYVKGIGLTKTWVPGPRVEELDPSSIPRGTAIATFWNGKYPNQSSGNHVAFYLGHNKTGIEVVEQWSGATVKQAREKRHPDGVIRFKGIKIPTDQTGPKPSMSGTAEYYYVILDKR